MGFLSVLNCGRLAGISAGLLSFLLKPTTEKRYSSKEVLEKSFPYSPLRTCIHTIVDMDAGVPSSDFFLFTNGPLYLQREENELKKCKCIGNTLNNFSQPLTKLHQLLHVKMIIVLIDFFPFQLRCGAHLYPCAYVHVIKIYDRWSPAMDIYLLK